MRWIKSYLGRMAMLLDLSTDGKSPLQHLPPQERPLLSACLFLRNMLQIRTLMTQVWWIAIAASSNTLRYRTYEQKQCLAECLAYMCMV